MGRDKSCPESPDVLGAQLRRTVRDQLRYLLVSEWSAVMSEGKLFITQFDLDLQFRL